MKLIRRQFLQVAAASLALATASQVAPAETNSAREVRVIVPCPAGSPTDKSARVFFQGLTEATGSRFRLENFPTSAGYASEITTGTSGRIHPVLFDLADCDNELSMPLVE